MGGGHGYNNSHVQLHLHQQHKATFLPMLCSRPSIKNVTIPKCGEDRSMESSKSTDPLSPKIGCMGQVKRNNKIIGFPSSTSSSSSSSSSSNRLSLASNTNNNYVVKYSKLRRIFSGRNLGSSITTTTSTYTSGRRRDQATSLNGRGVSRVVCKISDDDGRDNSSSIIRIEEMDPPLPVVKKGPKCTVDQEADSLWKRRSGGTALKSLQLQQIHVQLNNTQQQQHFAPTTV